MGGDSGSSERNFRPSTRQIHQTVSSKTTIWKFDSTLRYAPSNWFTFRRQTSTAAHTECWGYSSQCPAAKPTKVTGEGIGVVTGQQEIPRYLPPIQNLPVGSWKTTVIGSERCELSHCFKRSSSFIHTR